MNQIIHIQNKIIIVSSEPESSRKIIKKVNALGFIIAGIAETSDKAIQLLDNTFLPGIVIIDCTEIDPADSMSIASDIQSVISVFIIFIMDQSMINTFQNFYDNQLYHYIIKPVTLAKLNNAIINSVVWNKFQNNTGYYSRDVILKLFDLLPLACIVSDYDTGIFIRVNSFFYTFLGFEQGEVTGKTALELGIITEYNRNLIIKNVNLSRNVKSAETILKTKNNELKHVRISFDSVIINGEKRRFTILYDITEYKEMAHKLAESESRIREILETSVYISYRKDLLNNSYDYISPVIEKVLGYTPDEFKAFQFYKIVNMVHPEDRAYFLSAIDEIITNEDNKIFKLEYRLRHKNGNFRWIIVQIMPIKDRNGKLVSYIGSAGDITKRKEAEIELEKYHIHLEEMVEQRNKELIESEKHYKEILDSITDYVYHVNIKKGRVESVIYNERCFAVTGYFPYEFDENKTLWLDIVHKDDRLMFRNFLKKSLFGKGQAEISLEHRLIKKNGSLRWVKNTIVVNKNQDGLVTGYDGVISDITVIKKAENKIKQLNLDIINLQEVERQRLAENLHDSVGQLILAAKLSLDTYKQDPVFFTDQLDVALSFIKQSSNELRNIYTGLYPVILDQLGFKEAVRWLNANTLEKMNIKVILIIDLKSEIAHNLEIAIYRIIQEIISNILKHAQASNVYMSIVSSNNLFELIVKDDGVGFKRNERKKVQSGYGLLNIKNRVLGFDGKISIGNNQPHGTKIKISIDLKNNTTSL